MSETEIPSALKSGRASRLAALLVAYIGFARGRRSPPTLLFPTKMRTDPYVPQYGVTADGQRFIGLERVGGESSFTFLLNWRGASSK